jgi:MraZ protein
MDSKGRVAVPVVFRKKLAPDENTFFCVPGRDRAVEVHVADEWEEYQRRYLEDQPEFAPETQRSRRYLYSQSAEVTLDSQGRLLVPKHLQEEAGIVNDVVVAGMGSFFELWEPQRYSAFIAEAKQRYDSDRNAAARQGWEVAKGHGGRVSRGVSHPGDGR